jgi:hypothetical protein
MAFTKNFVFTDPTAANQAVQYAQLANQEQAQQDQAFNERMRNATQGRIAQQNAQQQQMLSQSNMMNQAAEREKDRANAVTVAGIQAGRTGAGGTFEQRVQAQNEADARAKRDDQKNKHLQGVALAKILINPNVPESEKARVRDTALKSGLITVDQRGYYKPAFEDPDAPVENIGPLLNKRAGMGPSTISVTPVPSPGPRPPSPSDFRVPVEYPGGPMVGNPRFSDMAAPSEPSPFETEGFKVFRQSDFIPQPPPAYDSSGMEVYR